MAFFPGGLARAQGPPQRGPGGRAANVFERYTEKARRVIFFCEGTKPAVWQPYLRLSICCSVMLEDKRLANRFLCGARLDRIHTQEMRRRSTAFRERISRPSVAVPLSAEVKAQILNMAAEKPQRLVHKHVALIIFFLASCAKRIASARRFFLMGARPGLLHVAGIVGRRTSGEKTERPAQGNFSARGI